MKKFLTLFCAVTLVTVTTYADVLLTEKFAQTTETLATNDNAFTDEIAATGWTNINGSGQIYMNATDLTYSGYKSATDGTGSAEYKTTFGKKAGAKLAKAIHSGSVYVAAIMDFSACTPASGNGRDYLWAFTPATSALSTAGNHFGRLCAQKSANTFQLGVAKNSESAAFISYTEELEYGKYLVVMEYQFVDGEKNDIVRLYINPTKGDKPAATIECKQSAENAVGTDVGSGTKDDPAQFSAFMLYSTNVTRLACLIDELKITTDWAELWEKGGDVVTTPSITADATVAFGEVTVGEAATKTLSVSGTNLNGDIHVVSSSEQVVVSAATISQADAAAGAKLTLTLTAAAEGAGSATVTLSSDGATDKVINVTWTGVAAAPSVENIAAMKSQVSWSAFVLNSQPVVVGFIEGYPVIQDASGAMILTDMLENSATYATLKVGDKVSGIYSFLLDEDDYVHAFATVSLAGEITIVSSDNALVPFDVTTATLTQYGPALIRLTQVSFTDTGKTQFAAGWFNISQNDVAARIQVPAGCDIIGETIPEKADVKGLLIYNNGGIAISASADITNRTTTPTGINDITTTPKAQKVMRNGQMMIIRDGKAFSVIGDEL